MPRLLVRTAVPLIYILASPLVRSYVKAICCHWFVKMRFCALEKNVFTPLAERMLAKSEPGPPPSWATASHKWAPMPPSGPPPTPEFHSTNGRKFETSVGLSHRSIVNPLPVPTSKLAEALADAYCDEPLSRRAWSTLPA